MAPNITMRAADDASARVDTARVSGMAFSARLAEQANRKCVFTLIMLQGDGLTLWATCTPFSGFVLRALAWTLSHFRF